MNSKTQLSLLFIFLAVVSISAFSYFSNSDDEITTIIENVPEEEIIEEESKKFKPKPWWAYFLFYCYLIFYGYIFWMEPLKITG